ncbi:hypothetical protein FB446DRAFT_709200 [Lentinula raphanica]|nr:hypothetical protein FB446DRAFT_709200 [Lentinula raphanica]
MFSNEARIAVEDAEETLEDGELEFDNKSEDYVEDTVSPHDPPNPAAAACSTSRKEKRRTELTRRMHTARAAAIECVSKSKQSDKSVLAQASPEQLVNRQAAWAMRWNLVLQKFTRWTDICRGDWKGLI